MQCQASPNATGRTAMLVWYSSQINMPGVGLEVLRNSFVTPCV